MNRFSIQIFFFLHTSYQMIERECITPRKLITGIVHPINKMPSVFWHQWRQTQLLHVCLMADWEALNTNSTAQNVQGNSRGIQCALNTEISDSPLEKLLYGFRRL